MTQALYAHMNNKTIKKNGGWELGREALQWVYLRD
jgi:hypothetical protein